MSAAIQAFDSNARRMTAALTQLGREAHKVRGVLDHAVATLAAHADIVNVVRAASGQLDAIASRLGGANGPSPGLDGLLDRMLRPAYSMSSERRVHDAYTGYAGDAAPAAAPAAEDLAEAVLF